MTISRAPGKLQMCLLVKVMGRCFTAVVRSGFTGCLFSEGFFLGFDPVKHAKVGSTLHIRVECLEYFLFCDVKAYFWVDTAPSSVSMIGICNMTLLERMGSPGRGFSAPC